MSIKILPPANAQERLSRQLGLAALRQQGLDVRAFAQTFRTIARGLDYQDPALKDIFNLCLDDPLPQWEMEKLRVLDFWNFSNCLHHCKDWQILTPPEPVCSEHLSLFGNPTEKRRLRRQRAARTASSVSVSTESVPVFPKPVPVIPESSKLAVVTLEVTDHSSSRPRRRRRRVYVSQLFGLPSDFPSLVILEGSSLG